MEIALSIAVGIGLAAACGFRIFVPLLIVGVAHRTGHLELAQGFDWLGSTPAMIGFGVATLLEVGAYYIPFVDNLLDTLATPSAVVAGAIVAASQVSALDPWLAWTVAIVGGGGAAGLVQGATAITRSVSSMATAGFANPLVSTVEAFAAVAMSILAVVAAPLALLGLLLITAWVIRRFLNRPSHPPLAA